MKSDERVGLYIRGWTAAGELRDEPEDGDEAVLTVRLTVDARLEPAGELVCDRMDDPRANARSRTETEPCLGWCASRAMTPDISRGAKAPCSHV